jgi:hypothetical protein
MIDEERRIFSCENSVEARARKSIIWEVFRAFLSFCEELSSL